MSVKYSFRFFLLILIGFCIIFYCVQKQEMTFKLPQTFQVLQPHSEDPSHSHQGHKGPLKVKDLPFHQCRVDKNRLVRIYDWVWVGSQWGKALESFSVCLSTQGSLDRLHFIPDIAQSWEGPISLAVFISSEKGWSALNHLVHFYRRCFPFFRDYVSVHVVLPYNVSQWKNPEDPEDLHTYNYFTCQESKELLAKILKTTNEGERAPPGLDSLAKYPQNHMRNIARKACPTEWTYSTDVDIIPRPKAALSLQEFLGSEKVVKKCGKCAFVIPTFELDQKKMYPRTKKELLEYLAKGAARAFHLRVFKPAHTATNYSLWMKTNRQEGPVKVSHDIRNFSLQYYEPFYVSQNNIPEFDERFVGYGFTRSSQVYEALAEGWRFKVLTPMFSIHWGLQSKKWRSHRASETRRNGKIFSQFKREMAARSKPKRKAGKRSVEKPQKVSPQLPGQVY